MFARSPSKFLATYGSVNAISSNISISSTSSSNRQRPSTRPRRHLTGNRRRYATITGSDGEERHHYEHVQYTWPKAPKGQQHPTPYQILDIKDDGVYSKARYYELVKLYHPDMSSVKSDDIPQHVRIERYRLIVAAHTILSDPMKRSAYDRFGAGWNGKADLGGRQTSYNGPPPGPFSRSWNDPSDPIWQNATWEDWERFYQWRARKNGTSVHRERPSPLYMNNSLFVLLVAVLALMGSTANSFRAHDAGAYFVEQRDIIHDKAAKELRRVRQDAAQSGSRQDRVDWFLRNREATLGLPGSDVETLRQEKVDRMLPERELCNSEEVAEKGG